MRRELGLGAALCTLLSAGACTAGVGNGDRPESVLPPHHVEGGFRNPGRIQGHGKASPFVTLPFFARRAVHSLFGSSAGAPARVGTDLPFLERNASDPVATVTWIGHSTLLVQMGNVTFLTDPIWSSTASPLPIGPKRHVAPAFAIDELPPIDFVVISHNHYDHMDLASLEMLAERGIPILVPLANAETLRGVGITNVVEMDWWQSRRIKGVSVHCVPAQHWSRRGLFDGNRALWSGWAVTAVDRRFFFAGDTGLFDGLGEIGTRLGPFDLAALPIGAYAPAAMMAPSHLNPEEAIEAADMLRAHRSLAVHFGTFDLSDEPIDEPPRRFRAASRAAGRSENHDWVLDVGETRMW